MIKYQVFTISKNSTKEFVLYVNENGCEDLDDIWHYMEPTDKNSDLEGSGFSTGGGYVNFNFKSSLGDEFCSIMFYGEVEKIEELYWGTFSSNLSATGGSSIAILESKIDSNLLSAITMIQNDYGLQEHLRSLNINSTKNLINSVGKYFENKSLIKINIPKDLLFAYQQFLNFFAEYLEMSKGIVVQLNTVKKLNTLEIEINTLGNIRLDSINLHLKEYLSFLNQEPGKILINLERELKDEEFEFLIYNLESEVKNLKTRLKISNLRKGINLQSRRNLLNDKKELDKKNIKSLVSQDDIKSCFAEIEKYMNSFDDVTMINSLIVLSSSFNRIQNDYRINVIDYNSYLRECNRIKKSILQLIDEIA